VHKGKEALYQLHQQRLEKQEKAREDLVYKEAQALKKMVYKNP